MAKKDMDKVNRSFRRESDKRTKISRVPKPPTDSKLKDIYDNRSQRRADVANKTFGIFGLVFLLILFVGIVRTLGGGNSVTFTSFLETLQNCPQIGYDWISFTDTDFSSTFPWGLQWLGSIFDFFMDIFSVSLFASTAVANIISVIFYFLRWLFL